MLSPSLHPPGKSQSVALVVFILAAALLAFFFSFKAHAGDIQFFPPSNMDTGCNSGTALMFDGVHQTYCGVPASSGGNGGAGTLTLADANGHHFVIPSYVSLSGKITSGSMVGNTQLVNGLAQNLSVFYHATGLPADQVQIRLAYEPTDLLSQATNGFFASYMNYSMFISKSDYESGVGKTYTVPIDPTTYTYSPDWKYLGNGTFNYVGQGNGGKLYATPNLTVQQLD